MGSIYHRFLSREGLLAEAWLNALEHFPAQFIDALAAGTLDAGLGRKFVGIAVPEIARFTIGSEFVGDRPLPSVEDALDITSKIRVSQ